jgi:hypothetical protein
MLGLVLLYYGALPFGAALLAGLRFPRGRQRDPPAGIRGGLRRGHDVADHRHDAVHALMTLGPRTAGRNPGTRVTALT